MPRRRDGPSEPYDAGTGQQGLGREPTPCRHQFGPRQTVVPLAGAEADMPGLCVLYQEVLASGDQGRCTEARARAENEPRAGARDRRPYPYQVGRVVLFEDAEDCGERRVNVDQPHRFQSERDADPVEVEPPGRVGQSRDATGDAPGDGEAGGARPWRSRFVEIDLQGIEGVRKLVVGTFQIGAGRAPVDVRTAKRA